MANGMERELGYTQMGPSIQACGSMIKEMDLGNSKTRKETTRKENGLEAWNEGSSSCIQQISLYLMDILTEKASE